MRIRINPSFTQKLYQQLDYIAKDKSGAAFQFYTDIEHRINQIPANPFLYRQSIFSDDVNVRDLIFKGYVITFRIRQEENVIEVFSFYKYQEG
jgi:hypothetical protein